MKAARQAVRQAMREDVLIDLAMAKGAADAKAQTLDSGGRR
ncbi:MULTISPECIES: hypothetical protein [Pseudomonas]|nr:hypothetical protein [Pseudomonas fulva]MCY4125871.1 hypothetical protein [Pseudomonas sp.]WKU93984.1 hypothetical protein Q3407_13720 [Pseudomonas fulva]